MAEIIINGTVSFRTVSEISWRRHNVRASQYPGFLDNDTFVFWLGKPCVATHASGITFADPAAALEVTDYTTTHRSQSRWHHALMSKCAALSHSDKSGRRGFSCTKEDESLWSVTIRDDDTLPILPWLIWLTNQTQKTH